MPIHRGPRLADLITRLAGVAQPLRANIYKTWPNLANGIGVTIGTGGEVYGSWVEFIAAASAPIVPFTVSHVLHYNSEGRGLTFQIGIGAAGSEVAVATATSLGYGYSVGWGVSTPTRFPFIPGGTRVAVRVRSDYTLGGITITPKIVSCLLPPRLDPALMLQLAQKVSNYYAGDGPTVHISTNLSIVAAWTYYATYAQVLGTTETQPFILTGISAWPTKTPAGATALQLALAYGGAGSETVFAEIPFQAIIVLNNQEAYEPFPLPFPIIIPPATRLAMKAASDVGWDGTNGSYFSGGTLECFRGGVYP